MIGPGIYNDACTFVREETGARAVLLLVIGGARGNGVSLQASLALTLTLPAMLRAMADQIEADGGPLAPDGTAPGP